MSSEARSSADEASSQCDDASSARSSGSDSGSDQDPRAALVDDEAEEDSSEGSPEEFDGTSHGLTSVDAEASFPQFTRLPPELRHRIWQDFCPDLSAKARVLQFTLSPSSAVMGRPDHHSVKDHLSLADQTQSLRAILATHGESRIIALKKFPDELGMDAGSGDAIVRFKKETDVIILHGLRTGKDYHLPNFSREVQNIAVNPWELFFGGLLNGPVDEAIPALANIFRSLKRLYVCTAAEAQKAYQIRWCVTDYVHTYLVETHEKEAGLGEDTQSLFCWPDVDEHLDFAKYSIPKLFSRGKDVEVGVEMWPMVEFEFEEGIAQYDKLRVFKDALNTDEEMGLLDSDEELVMDDYLTDASLSGVDLDEYESEGIDDGELDQADDSSEEDLASPMLGRFSSLEPASEDGRELQTNGGGPSARRSRKRRAALLDSDDEDSAPQTKRTRKAHMVIDSSDGDDDDGEGEGEEDAQGDKDNVSRQPKSRPRRTMPSYEDEEEDEEEEEEDDDDDDHQYDVGDSRDSDSESPLDAQSEQEDTRSGQRMSLAERLRRARQECPVSSGTEADSQDEDQGDPSEDEDEEESEGQDEEDGLLDVMAEELDDSQSEQDDGW